MPLYDVCQVEEEIKCRRWIWRGVEADSAAEAEAKVRNGEAADAEPVDQGEQGDWYNGKDGVCAVPRIDSPEAWDAAFNEATARMGHLD